MKSGNMGGNRHRDESKRWIIIYFAGVKADDHDADCLFNG